MYKFNFCYLFLFLIFNNICLCDYLDLEVKNVCKVIGDEKLFPIYRSGYNPKIISNGNLIELNETSYRIDYCECYTENGNCRVSISNYDVGNLMFYKNIFEFEYQKDSTQSLKIKYPSYPENIQTNLTSPDFDSIYKDYLQYLENKKKDDIEYYFENAKEYMLVNRGKANATIDTISFSINELLDNYKSYTLSSINSLLINDNDNMTFPIYYFPKLSLYGEDMFKFKYIFGEFKIRKSLECINDRSTFDSDNTIQNHYTFKNYTPMDINCTWGDSFFKFECNNCPGFFIYNGHYSFYKNIPSTGLLLLISLLLGIGLFFN